MANRVDFERLWEYVTSYELYDFTYISHLHKLFPMFTIWQIEQLQKIIITSGSINFRLKVYRKRFFDYQTGIAACRHIPKEPLGDDMSVLQAKAYKELEDRSW